MSENFPYVTRSLATDAASLEACSARLGVTSAPTPTDYLKWLYAENPWGQAVGTNAYAGDALVAHYTTVPIVANLEGKRTWGLVSLNTATHPEHQGKGLFTKLAELTYARAQSLGFEFVIGVANANSTPGFTRKLGFQLVTPLDVLVGAGRITASHDDRAKFALAWTDDALRWRLRRPGAAYCATAGDAPSVFAPTKKAGIHAYMGFVPPSLVDHLPRIPRTQPLRMWIGLDPHLERRGVLAPLPDRLKPSPLNLIFRDLAGKNRQLDRATTRFTLLDFDAY